MKRIKVSVTKNDIRRGVAQRTDRCPVALAVTRALRSQAFVETDEIRVHIPVPCRMTTPRKAAQFIQSFDGGQKVNPFTFYLRKL